MMRCLLPVLFFLLACQPQKDGRLVLENGQILALPYEKTVSTVIHSEPASLDWTKSSDADSSWIEGHLMSGLVAFNLREPGLKLEPALALRWESQENGKVWRFFLREGVQWSDGVPFTSKHVVDAFRRLLDPNVGALSVDNAYPIAGAKDYNEGQLVDFSRVGVRARGPLTVEFQLEQPMAFFPMLLTHHTMYPIRQDLIDKYQESWTEPENFVGLGPYSLIYWRHDSRLVLKRNEKYWGEPPAIQFVNFYMIEKDATTLRMFERGKIDLIRNLPSSELPRLRKKAEFRYFPGLRLYYYGFKIQKKPIDDKRVRRALALSIDKREIVKVIGGGQLPLQSWVPHGLPGHSDRVGLPFDVARARELLRQAGYEKSEVFPNIKLGFNTGEMHRRVAENIQAQWKRNLGIEVELKNEEWKTFLSGLKSDSVYSIFRLGWVADYPDPHTFMSILASYSPNNRTGWRNSRFDELVRRGRGEIDLDKRLAMYQEAQRLLLEDEAPVIPLFTNVNQVLVSQRILNYHSNVLDIYNFYEMDLKP